MILVASLEDRKLLLACWHRPMPCGHFHQSDNMFLTEEDCSRPLTGLSLSWQALAKKVETPEGCEFLPLRCCGLGCDQVGQVADKNCYWPNLMWRTECFLQGCLHVAIFFRVCEINNDKSLFLGGRKGSQAHQADVCRSSAYWQNSHNIFTCCLLHFILAQQQWMCAQWMVPYVHWQ